MYKDGEKRVDSYFSNNTIRENTLPLVEKIFDTTVAKKTANKSVECVDLLTVPSKYALTKFKPGTEVTIERESVDLN